MKKFYVMQTDLTTGKQQLRLIMANTPRGASNIVSRDFYLYLSKNEVYEIDVYGQLVKVYPVAK